MRAPYGTRPQDGLLMAWLNKILLNTTRIRLRSYLKYQRQLEAFFEVDLIIDSMRLLIPGVVKTVITT